MHFACLRRIGVAMLDSEVDVNDAEWWYDLFVDNYARRGTR